MQVAVQGLYSGSLSEKSEYAIVASINHGGSLWRTADGERLYNWNHSKELPSTIIASDIDSSGRWALTAEAHTLVLWDLQNGAATRFWNAPGEILDAKLGPNGRFALLGLDTHNAVVFDVQRGGILFTLVHQNRVRSVDLSADGKIAVTGSEDYSARTWNMANGKLIQRYQHEDDVQLVRLSRDGSLVLSASKYDKAVVWQSQSGDILGEVALKAEQLKRGVRFISARFSDDNSQLLTGRPDQWVELWELQSFQTVARWKIPKKEKWKPTSAAALAVGFSKHPNTVVALASNGNLHHFKTE